MSTICHMTNRFSTRMPTFKFHITIRKEFSSFLHLYNKSSIQPNLFLEYFVHVVFKIVVLEYNLTVVFTPRPNLSWKFYLTFSPPVDWSYCYTCYVRGIFGWGPGMSWYMLRLDPASCPEELGIGSKLAARFSGFSNSPEYWRQSWRPAGGAVKIHEHLYWLQNWNWGFIKQMTSLILLQLRLLNLNIQ